MRFPVLFRRCQLWVPTLAGWVLLLTALVGVGIWAGRHLHPFLAVDEPIAAPVLVVEGWMAPDELDQVVTRFRNYNHVITTGGLVPEVLYRLDRPSYAALAREYLVQRGLPDQAVTSVPTPDSARDRTYLSAVMVREWLQTTGRSVDAIDVFSSGVHSRRSRAVYRLAFGKQVRVGILTTRSLDYDPAAWWTTSTGAKTVLAEMLGWVWTELFFWPDVPGSQEEKWGQPPPEGKS